MRREAGPAGRTYFNGHNDFPLRTVCSPFLLTLGRRVERAFLIQNVFVLNNIPLCLSLTPLRHRWFYFGVADAVLASSQLFGASQGAAQYRVRLVIVSVICPREIAIIASGAIRWFRNNDFWKLDV